MGNRLHPQDHDHSHPADLHEHEGHRPEQAAGSATGLQPGPCESSDHRALPGGPEHDHDHHHDHDHEEERGRRGGHHHHHERIRDRGKLLLTLGLTVSMMLAEAVGGWLSGSLALLSDAGHMLTDSAALLLAVLALWFSSKPADLKRTYGFFRLEVLSALLNGLTLLGIAGLIGYEAWERIADPRPIRAELMLLVATVGLAVNVAGMVMLSHSKNMSVRGAFLHVAGDALSSVGVIAAGAVAWFTGWTLLDPIISVGIALIIVVGAVGLVRQAVHVLLEAVPEHIDLVEVFAAMRTIGGVTAVHDLHVWTISHHLHALSAHLVVGDAVARAGHDEILASAREMLKNRFGIDHSTLQIESETFARGAER